MHRSIWPSPPYWETAAYIMPAGLKIFSWPLKQHYSRQELCQHYLPFLVTMNVAVSHTACSAFPTGQERGERNNTNSLSDKLLGKPRLALLLPFSLEFRNCSVFVNSAYVRVCPGGHKLLRSSFRPQSKGFPKDRFLSIVLTRIFKKVNST